MECAVYRHVALGVVIVETRDCVCNIYTEWESIHLSF